MIVAVTATRNEPLIAPFIQHLYDHVDHVVICDESTDGGCTQWNAHSAGAAVLNCHGGIGPSLMAGWECAIEAGADSIVQIDAGGSHRIDDIPNLYGDADITVGSRFVFGGTYTGRQWRAGASRAYAYTMDWRSGEHLADWTSGFRRFTAESARDLLGFEYRASGHGWQAEVLLRAFECGMTVSEAPIHYTAGDSSFRLHHAIEAARVR